MKQERSSQSRTQCLLHSGAVQPYSILDGKNKQDSATQPLRCRSQSGELSREQNEEQTVAKLLRTVDEG